MRNQLLKELVKVVSPNRTGNIQMIGYQQDKVEELYNSMLKEQFTTRNEAINHFFEGQFGNIYYCNLEKKLQERLINTLLCTESKKTNTEVQKAYFLCNKNLAAIQILRGEGKRKLAVPVAENTLKIALKYELSEIISALAKMLQYHYAVIEGNYKKFQFYSKIVKRWGEILQAEERIQSYFCELAFHSSKSKSPSPERVEMVNQQLNELMALAKEYGTFRLNLFAYNIFVIKYQLTYNHENVISVCKEAIIFFNSLEYQPPYTAKFSFLYKTIPAYIHLGQFGKANESIVECLKLVPRGTHNWSVVMQYQLILAFHSENYNLAFQLTKEVKQNGNQLYDNIKEQWKIYEAYCYFFIEIGKIQYNGKPFRVGRFINEIPIYSKDKRGYHISILVIQILFLLHRKKYDDIIERAESLRQYIYNYLTDSYTYRSNQFIRMILNLPQSRFNRVAIERKAEKYLKKLQSKPLWLGGQDADVEIVPYETLWKCILNLLD